ncbi:MAG: lysophospholipid acyltransferase family protein [Sulfitobacter sp.]
MTDRNSAAPTPAPRDRFSRRAGHYLTNLVFVGIVGLARALPYGFRVRLFGWLMQHVLGPLAGYRKRARAHIAYVWPALSPADTNRIAAACLNNMGRSLIENYSARDFPARMASLTPEGPGLAALEQAAAAGRPVILATGHYGNYEAARAALVARGYDIGGLYRNMKNPYFNAHYVKTMQAFGGPVFPQGRAGTAGFVRHLKNGGHLVLLHDQHVMGAPQVDFMGHPANTAISAAELALRYDALLIPFYGIRNPDGLSFTARIEAPIAHSDALEMTRALTRSLENRITFDPGQWFWVHRRWRPQD